MVNLQDIEFCEIKEESQIFSIIQSISDVKESVEKRVDLKEYSKKLAKFATNFVIKGKGEIKCFSSTYCNDKITKTAFISLIACPKNCRHGGYGGKMIEYLFDYCYSLGMEKIKLEVNKTNEKAIAFYNKYQMQKVGETESGYFLEKSLKD